MEMRCTYRKALADEVPRIMEIIRQAQAQMRARGSLQWQNGYPAERDIRRDLERGWGYVIADGEEVIAYGAVVFDGEAAYDRLEGEWLTHDKYVVVHRLAVADERKRQGFATRFLHLTAALALSREVHAFRIDTNFDNAYMLKMLNHTEFIYCGKVRYESGERLAYEKRL